MGINQSVVFRCRPSAAEPERPPSRSGRRVCGYREATASTDATSRALTSGHSSSITL
jgi:hypothetical protein